MCTASRHHGAAKENWACGPAEPLWGPSAASLDFVVIGFQSISYAEQGWASAADVI